MKTKYLVEISTNVEADSPFLAARMRPSALCSRPVTGEGAGQLNVYLSSEVGHAHPQVWEIDLALVPASPMDIYVREGGVRCPNCGSSDIEGSNVDIIEGGAFQSISCTVCYARWTDCYTLTSFSEMEVPSAEPTMAGA